MLIEFAAQKPGAKDNVTCRIAHLREVAMVDAREEVVLNLKIETSCEEERRPAHDTVVHERVRCHDLVLVKVTVRDVDALVREVVHLRRHHERQRHNT